MSAESDAIDALTTMLEGRIDTLNANLVTIDTSIGTLNTTVGAIDTTMSTSLATTNATLSSIEADFSDLKDGIEALIEAIGPLEHSVTSLTRSNSTATATVSNHGLSTGDSATISGANQAQYNGTFEITVVDVDTFTYTVTGAPATPATGTIIAVFAAPFTTIMQTIKNQITLLEVGLAALVTAFGGLADQAMTQNVQDLRDDTREGLEMSKEALRRAGLSSRISVPGAR